VILFTRILSGLICAIFSWYPNLLSQMTHIPSGSSALECIYIFHASCLIIYFTTFILFFINLCSGKYRKKERSQIFKELEKEFKDKKIIKKIKEVCDWKRNNPDEGEYKKQYYNPEQYSNFDKLHSGRRDVIEYHQKIIDYFEVRKLISLEDVKSLVPKNRINILLNIFEPIEKEIEDVTNDIYDPKVFRSYENI